LRFDLAEVPSLLLSTNSTSLGFANGNALPGWSSPLIVGASVASGHSGTLPEVLDEAKAVARFGQRPNVLLGGQATGEQVASRLGTAPAIHFAGHAIEEGGSTKLLLASSGAPQAGANPVAPALESPYLDSAVLRKHPPRSARLVVFSACSTGKKEAGWNHGMDDIVDTLAALGVPEVVATRWQIDSAAAVPMMDAFYSGLAQGENVSHALTTARHALMRDPRYHHPYYWGAYYASGAGRSDLSQIFRQAK
jgi:CHAT domain-containing protein